MTMNYAAMSAALQKMSDQQLMQEMSNPSGQVPQFLVMSEIQRRKAVRSEQTKPVDPTTVASQMKPQAPMPAQMGVAGQPQMASADPQAYAGGGIVALAGGGTPDDKLNALPTDFGPGAVPYVPSFNLFTPPPSAAGAAAPTPNGFNATPIDPDIDQSFLTTGMMNTPGMPQAPGWQNPESNNNVQKYLGAVANLESGGRPNVIVGGKTFTDFSQHPGIVGVTTKDGPSTAAGLYQITKSTWDRIAPKLGLKDFSPASQQAVALELIREKGAMNDVMNGDFDTANKKLGGTWQGLPTGASVNQAHGSQDQFDAAAAGGIGGYKSKRNPPKLETGLDPRLMNMMKAGAFQPVPVDDEPDQPDRPEAADVDALADKVNKANPDMLGAVLDRTDKRLDALKGRKSDDINMALIQAGLGMMAGKSRYAMQNIGEGGMAGLKQYTEQQDQLNKDEMAIQNHRDAVVEAQQAAKAGNFKTAAELAKNSDLVNSANYGHDVGLYGTQQATRRGEMQYNNMGQHLSNQYNLGIMGQALGQNRMDNQFNQQVYHTDALYDRNEEMAGLRQQANTLAGIKATQSAALNAQKQLQDEYKSNKPMIGAMSPQQQAQYSNQMDAWVKQQMMGRNPDYVKALWGANAFVAPPASTGSGWRYVDGQMQKVGGQ